MSVRAPMVGIPIIMVSLCALVRPSAADARATVVSMVNEGRDQLDLLVDARDWSDVTGAWYGDVSRPSLPLLMSLGSGEARCVRAMFDRGRRGPRCRLSVDGPAAARTVRRHSDEALRFAMHHHDAGWFRAARVRARVELLDGPHGLAIDGWYVLSGRRRYRVDLAQDDDEARAHVQIETDTLNLTKTLSLGAPSR